MTGGQQPETTMSAQQMVMIKEFDQVIQPAVPLSKFQAANQFIADLVAEAVENGTYTMSDEEGCEITATVWTA
jgi:predicted peroxiredoxin